MNEKGRTIFYGIGAAYLLYLAYDMFQGGAMQGEDGLAMTIFCVLFAAAGAVLLVLAVKQYKKCLAEDAMPEDDMTESDELSGIGEAGDADSEAAGTEETEVTEAMKEIADKE